MITRFQPQCFLTGGSVIDGSKLSILLFCFMTHKQKQQQYQRQKRNSLQSQKLVQPNTILRRTFYNTDHIFGALLS